MQMMGLGEVTVNALSWDFDRFITKRHSISLQCLCTYFLFLIPLSRSVAPLLNVSGTTLFRKRKLDHARGILSLLCVHGTPSLQNALTTMVCGECNIFFFNVSYLLLTNYVTFRYLLIFHPTNKFKFNTFVQLKFLFCIHQFSK